MRLALTEGEAGATAAREQAHARQLEIGRWQQQIQFNRQQIEELARQAGAVGEEVRELEDRREPAPGALVRSERRPPRRVRTLGGARPDVARCDAEYAAALVGVQAIEQEAGYESVRRSCAASTTLGALQQVRDHAATARDRVAAELERLGVEVRELSAEAERVRRASTRPPCGKLADSRRALETRGAERLNAERSSRAERAEHERLTQALAANASASSPAGTRGCGRSRRSRPAARRLATRPGSSSAKPEARVRSARRGRRSPRRRAFVRAGRRRARGRPRCSTSWSTVTTMSSAAFRLLSEQNAGRCGFVVLDDAQRRAAGRAARSLVPQGARALVERRRARSDRTPA